MSLSPRKPRMARSISDALVFPERMTSANASSALAVQCHASSNASICAWLSVPSGPLNSTL
jgi:hypothetical protein